jgi:flagellar basal-body rod modification protein FlgD
MAGVEDVLKSDAAQYQYDASKLTQTSAVSNKSDMTMDDFWKLMAAQLQYQDPMNPMSNSDMMNQMTQMATMNAMTQVTDAVAKFATVSNNLSQVTLTTYSTGLLGKEVTVAITNDEGEVTGTKKGTVTGVDLTGATAVYIDGKKYELSQVMGIGDVPVKIPEKDEDKTDTDKEDETDKTDTDNTTDGEDKE